MEDSSRADQQAFRLGFSGTVIGIFLAVCIAVPLTLAGYGPLSFATGANMLHKIVIIQIVVAIALFIAFPVASLLEDRTQARTVTARK